MQRESLLCLCDGKRVTEYLFHINLVIHNEIRYPLPVSPIKIPTPLQFCQCPDKLIARVNDCPVRFCDERHLAFCPYRIQGNISSRSHYSNIRTPALCRFSDSRRTICAAGIYYVICPQIQSCLQTFFICVNSNHSCASGNNCQSQEE